MVVAAQRRVTSAVDPDSGARYESAKGRNEDIANHAGYILMLHSNKVRLPVLYGTCRIPGRRPEMSPCWAAVAPSCSPAWMRSFGRSAASGGYPFHLRRRPRGAENGAEAEAD